MLTRVNRPRKSCGLSNQIRKTMPTYRRRTPGSAILRDKRLAPRTAALIAFRNQTKFMAKILEAPPRSHLR